jgi:hypothetical protein
MTERKDLTTAELDDIAERIKKGWVIRRDQMERLLGMARSKVDAAENKATMGKLSMASKPDPYPFVSKSAPYSYAFDCSAPWIDPRVEWMLSLYPSTRES